VQPHFGAIWEAISDAVPDAPAVVQGTRKFFHDRRLARAAHGEVAHHDDEAAQRLVAQDAVAVEPQAQLHNPAEQVRAQLQERPENRRQRALAAAHDHVDGELLELLGFMTKPPVGHEQIGFDAGKRERL